MQLAPHRGWGCGSVGGGGGGGGQSNNSSMLFDRFVVTGPAEGKSANMTNSSIMMKT